MESARHRVRALLELAARVQHGQRHFGRRLFLCGVHAGGNAASVVHHGDAAVDVDRHLDGFAEPGHVFVDAVIDDFVDEVMQPVHAGAADIHGRPLPDGIEPFENFDLIRAVTIGFGFGGVVLLVVLGHSAPKF